MKINTHELAWAAGFFDGEGHTAHKRGIRKSDPQRRIYHNIILDIRQVDRRALDRFAKAVGTRNRVYGPWRNKNPNSSHFYCFALSNAQEVQRIVKLMWPWMGEVKREQVKTAIKAWKNEKRFTPGRKPGWGLKNARCHPRKRHRAFGMCDACYIRNRRHIIKSRKI